MKIAVRILFLLVSTSILIGISLHLTPTSGDQKEQSETETVVDPRHKDASSIVHGKVPVVDAIQIPPLPEELKTLIRDYQKKGRSGEEWANLLELAWKDIPDCFRYIDRIEATDAAERRKANILNMIASIDIGRLEEGLSLLQSAKLSKETSAFVTANVAAKDPATVFKYAIAHFAGQELESALIKVITAFVGMRNIEEATVAFQHVSSPMLRAYSIKIIASSLAVGNDDPGIGLRWAANLVSSEERKQAELAILGSRGSKAPTYVLVDLVGALRNEDARANGMVMIAERLASEDRQGAEDWAANLPTTVKGRAQAKVAEAMAKTNIAEGTAYALRISESWPQSSAIDAIGRNVYSSSPSRAKEWLNTLPDSLRERAAFSFAAKWIRDDPTSTVNWLNSLPEGLTKDRALSGAATAYGIGQSLALEIAAVIGDPWAQALAMKTVRGFNPANPTTNLNEKSNERIRR